MITNLQFDNLCKDISELANRTGELSWAKNGGLRIGEPIVNACIYSEEAGCVSDWFKTIRLIFSKHIPEIADYIYIIRAHAGDLEVYRPNGTKSALGEFKSWSIDGSKLYNCRQYGGIQNQPYAYSSSVGKNITCRFCSDGIRMFISKTDEFGNHYIDNEVSANVDVSAYVMFVLKYIYMLDSFEESILPYTDSSKENELLHMLKNEDKLGQNFTPSEQVKQLFLDAIPDLYDLVKANWSNPTSEVLHKIESFKVYDPCCGDGAILKTCYQILSHWAKHFGGSYSQSNLYGTDIDKALVSITKSTLPLAHISQANSLLVDWHDTIITNVPFERALELNRPDFSLGKETYDAWTMLGREGSNPTCAQAFVKKWYLSGLPGAMIVDKSTPYNTSVPIEIIRTYTWKGDATIDVSHIRIGDTIHKKSRNRVDHSYIMSVGVFAKYLGSGNLKVIDPVDGSIYRWDGTNTNKVLPPLPKDTVVYRIYGIGKVAAFKVPADNLYLKFALYIKPEFQDVVLPLLTDEFWSYYKTLTNQTFGVSHSAFNNAVDHFINC